MCMTGTSTSSTSRSVMFRDVCSTVLAQPGCSRSISVSNPGISPNIVQHTSKVKILGRSTGPGNQKRERKQIFKLYVYNVNILTYKLHYNILNLYRVVVDSPTIF